MKGYWIGRYDVRDPETYKLYAEAAKPAFAEFGAVPLARAGRSQAMEGPGRGRNVVVEFPSYRAALDCWNSATYQAARQHRLPVSEGEIVIVEGL
jgi:uncharacterized protein (DUF1330 family)